MKTVAIAVSALALALQTVPAADEAAPQKLYSGKPIKALLITGGCCHNYVIEKLWPGAKTLATSKSERTQKEHPVAWVNQFGKARVFGTTYGHSDATFRDPTFIKLLARGIVWAAGKDAAAKSAE